MFLGAARPPPGRFFPPRPDFRARFASHTEQNHSPAGGTVRPMHGRWNCEISVFNDCCRRDLQTALTHSRSQCESSHAIMSPKLWRLQKQYVLPSSFSASPSIGGLPAPSSPFSAGACAKSRTGGIPGPGRRPAAHSPPLSTICAPFTKGAGSEGCVADEGGCTSKICGEGSMVLWPGVLALCAARERLMLVRELGGLPVACGAGGI